MSAQSTEAAAPEAETEASASTERVGAQSTEAATPEAGAEASASTEGVGVQSTEAATPEAGAEASASTERVGAQSTEAAAQEMSLPLAARAIGWLWAHVVPVRRGLAQQNVQRAFPEHDPAWARRVASQNLAHLSALALSALRRRPPPDLETIHGIEHIRAALQRGRGVLLLSAHLGDFEHLVRIPHIDGHRLWVVTRRFRARWAQALWAYTRRRGAGLIHAFEGAQRARAALRRGELVAYVLDQHTPPGRAVWVPFFGQPAATSPDLVRLAQLTGAAIVPVFASRAQIWAQPEVLLPRTGDAQADVLEGTRRCAAIVEAAIRQYPEQWLWIHRRWKPPPPDVARALAQSPTGCVGRRRSLSKRGGSATN